MKKKFFVFFAVLLSMTLQAASPWDGTIAASYAGGTGALSDPWQISTPAELAYLGSIINANPTTDYTGKYFILTSDLDLNNKPWTPIGSTNKFKGTFDGKSHVISNLNVNVTTSNAGLFGSVQYAYIKNVGIVGTSTVTGTGNVGGLVGQFTGYGTPVYGISGCFSNATVSSGTGNAGGIVGNFYFSGTNTCSITNCYSTGNISGTNNVAGIVGKVTVNSSTGTSLSISNSYATGTLTATGTAPANLTGGIATSSAANLLNVANCYYINGDAANAYGAIAVTASDMITADFLTALNNGGTAWKADFAGSNVNNGYPILAWRNLSTGVKNVLVSNCRITVIGKTVKIEAPVSIKDMELYNFSGQLVDTKNTNYQANQLSFDVQHAGIYLLIAHTAEGQQTQKIIVN